MQIKFEKIDVKKVLRDYFMLTMACFFFAMAWECFLIRGTIVTLFKSST